MSAKEKFETLGLLDSGADISAMPKAVAELIGIKLGGKITPVYGIGGKVDSIETMVNITIEKGHEHYNIQIPIKVILGDYDFPILLGRAGFFDEFIISFNQSQEKISLKKVLRR